MDAAKRVWWEALADQYEEWAENPPRWWHGAERYTCSVLDHSGLGWWSGGQLSPTGAMQLLWVWQYGDTPCPAGDTRDPSRPEKRFEFCWCMSEAIREYLETGRGPWEDA